MVTGWRPLTKDKGCVWLFGRRPKSLGAGLGPNSTWLVSTRLDTFDFVERVDRLARQSRTCRASRDERVERDECVELCFSNMADDEEAVMLACTSLVVCALSVHVKKSEKRHVVWMKDYLKKDSTFFSYNSLLMTDLQSDLVKLHAHRHRAV